MPPTHYLTLGFEQINSFQRPSTPRFPGSNRGQESRRSVPKAQYSKTARIFKKKQCTDRTVVEQRVRRCGQKQPESHRHWMTGWAVLKHGGPLGSPAAGFQRPSAPPPRPPPRRKRSLGRPIVCWSWLILAGRFFPSPCSSRWWLKIGHHVVSVS